MTKQEAEHILAARLQVKELLLKQEGKQLPKLHKRFLNMYNQNIKDSNYEWTLKALVKQEQSFKRKNNKFNI